MCRGVMTFQYSHRLLRPHDERPSMPEVSSKGCRAQPTAARFNEPSGAVSDIRSVNSVSTTVAPP